MEEKINIAKILKDKPEGTKLWTDMFGSVTLYVVTVACDAFQVKHHNKEPWFDKDGKLYKEGVLCIYPSKSMRDWEKLTWKDGDVLVNSSGFKLFFDRWANDDYTRFFGKVNLLEDSFSYETEKYTLASKDETLDTLEIEKPEFKDGDIIKMTWDKYSAIAIFWEYSNFGKGFDSHVFFNINTKIIEYNIHGHTLQDMILRLATEEEKQQLFDTLAKEGKAWDAEKKKIMYLKPKVELRPFDKVLVRDSYNDMWRASFFSHIKEDDGRYVTTCCTWKFCIPYIGNESLVGTTKDVEG